MPLDVPILGQPVQFITTYPTTLLKCNCDPDPKALRLLIVIGFNVPTACPRCGGSAVVEGIKVRPEDGAILPVIKWYPKSEIES